MTAQLCDYCDTTCAPSVMEPWKNPMDALRLTDGAPQMGSFIICVHCVQLAVEAAVHGEVAPPPALPRSARSAFLDAQDRWAEGVKRALEIEEALAGGEA